MLSLRKLEQLLDRDAARTLDAVAANGLPLPLPLRVRLQDEPAGAWALGLRRAAELAYGPCEAVRRWLDRVASTASGAADCLSDPAAWAAVAAGVGRVVTDWPGLEPAPGAGTDVAARVLATATDALAGLQSDDGLLRAASDATLEDALLTSCFALALLADRPEVHPALRWGDLLAAVEQHADRLPAAADLLWQMARCVPATTHQNPRLAA